MAIRPGYMGYLKFTDADDNTFYTWVSDATRSLTRDYIQPDLAQASYDRVAYASGSFQNSLSFSGPVGNSTGSLISGACGRDSCGELATYTVNMVLFCGDTTPVTLSGAKINNLTLSVSAGDIATFSCEVLGGAPGTGTAISGEYVPTCGALSTWRDFSFSCDDTQSFELSIANNLEYIWSMASGAGNDNGGNVYVLEGIRTVTGSYSCYSADICVVSGTTVTGFAGVSIPLGGPIFDLSSDYAQSSSPYVRTANWQAFCAHSGGVWTRS